MYKIIKSIFYNIYKKIKEVAVAAFKLYIRVMTPYSLLIKDFVWGMERLSIKLKRKLMFYLKQAIIFSNNFFDLFFEVIEFNIKLLKKIINYIKSFFE